MGTVKFSGVTQPVVTLADQIQEVIMMPSGYESIGELSISCRDSNRSDALAVLDTIDDCRLERLVSAMKAEASRVGGELLVQRQCDTDSHVTRGFDRAPASTQSIECRGVVARRTAAGNNAGTTLGVPNSQLPKALRTAPAAAPIDPAVVDATVPYETHDAP